MSHRDHWNTNQWFSSPSQHVKFNGLINQGATSDLNSVLQVLFMTEDFREAVERYVRDNPETEFIDCQLNNLFDTLKRHTAQTNKITEKLKISRVYEERDAAEYFEKILKLTSSEASQIFHGTLTHRTICSNCENPSDSDGKFWHLPLTLSSDGEYSVVDGISEYFRDTHFSGDDQIYCDICDDKYDATLKCVLKHPPEVLMLLLKRFELNIYTLTYFKNKRTVHVPSRLQISENQTYELYAYVEHFGDLGGGHYSATIKSEEDDKWYKFNDTTVTSLNVQPFWSDNFDRSDEAYLLFYRKKSDQAACTPQDTDVMSAPEECSPSSVVIYGQPPKSEILRKEGDMAEDNRVVGVIATDQDDGTGFKDDEDSVSLRAERPSPEPCFKDKNHVNVERNHWHLQLQDNQSDQERLVPNDEEVKRESEHRKKNSSFKAGKNRDEDQTCEVKLKETTSTSQYGQKSIKEVRNIHEYPQNEGKTRKIVRIDAEIDLKVDPNEQTERTKEGQHHDEEGFSFVRQDMIRDRERGQQVGPDYDIKLSGKVKQGGENMNAKHDSEVQMAADVTKPNSSKILDLIYDRMQGNERTGKWMPGKDHRYDRDVKHKEEMNVDRWKEENRWGQYDHDAHMSFREHGQGVVVVSDRQGKKQNNEVKTKEAISTSQYVQRSFQEISDVHEYPQNEGKTRENERVDAEGDLKVDPEEQTESKEKGQHHDEERFSFVRQNMTGDTWSGQRVGPDYDIRSCREDKKCGEERASGQSEVYSESHIGADVTKPNRGNLFDLVDDRMQDNEKTGKKKQGRDRRYDRDVRLKEEMNVDRSKEENRWGECDHDTHISVRDHRQDVVVVPERHRRMQVDEYCQNKDDSFLSGVKRRGTTDARGEVRAESNVDNVSERQPSTSKKEVKIKIYEETEVTPGSIERRLIREKSLQRTSDSRGNSLADDDKSRKEGFPGHFNITSHLKKDNNQSLSKCMRNLDLNESEQKQRAKREIGDVQEEDETKQVEKRVRAESESQEQDAAVKHETKSKKLHMKLRWPSSAKKTRKGRKKSCVLLCASNKYQILDSD